MIDRRRHTREIRMLMKKSLPLLGLCLICSLPLLAVGAGAPSGQDQQSATPQESSNQQASSSASAGSDAGAVAPASASHYSAVSEDANSSSATVASTPPRAPAAPDSDAGWTPAAAVNAWLPHWLKLSGEFRDRMEGHTAYGFKPGVDDEFDLTRARLGIDFVPSSYFHAFVQARDAEVFGAENPAHTTNNMKDVFDLSQAFVEFRNAENGWFSLKAGRPKLLVECFAGLGRRAAFPQQ
jgi:hypothetical protein